MPSRSNCCVWPSSRATRLTSPCCSGSTSVTPLPLRPARPGAADAVHVRRVVLRRIEVDHVRDVVEVEPARGDVRRDERRHVAAAEPRQRALARALRHVAVQRRRLARRGA